MSIGRVDVTAVGVPSDGLDPAMGDACGLSVLVKVRTGIACSGGDTTGDGTTEDEDLAEGLLIVVDDCEVSCILVGTT